MHNVLHEFKRIVRLDESIEEQVNEAIISHLYSYLIYANCDDNNSIEYYTIKFMTSQDDVYNTIPRLLAVSNILDCIHMYKDYKGPTKIIGHRQPPLDVMIELYEPLIQSMSISIQRYWQNFEIDDLCQICRLCICDLYDKGYYVHKRLLWTSFRNKIVEEVRPLKKRGEIIPLEVFYNDKHGGEDKLSLADIISDKVAEEQQEDTDITEANLEIFVEIKDIIIDLVGPRQFDMLFRDYSKCHTTPASRKLLQKIKSHLKELGITQSQFNEKYHRKGN